MIVLHTESSPNFGGQELRIIHEMIGLEEYGIRSILMCKKNSAIYNIAKEKGLLCYTADFKSSIDPISTFKIKKVVKKHKVNVINSHSGYDAWCSVPVCIMNNIPFIRSRHIGLRLKNNILTRYMYEKFAKKVVVTSNYIKEQIKNICLNVNNIEVVPTGIDLTKFNIAKKFNLREKHNISNDDIVLGFISVLKSDKGLHILLESLSNVITELNNVKLIVAGDGNFMDRCKKLSNELKLDDKVIFLGHIQEVYGLFKEIDIFILPAIRPEGIPQSILQAFAARKPVIASDIGGINEVAIHNETAYLVKPRDVGDLAKGILYLINNKDYRLKIAENGYKLVNEKYTIKNMLEKMNEIYRSL